jgi:hypothetical protein
MKNERLKMTVTMDVTVSQALALQAMFNQWNRLASWGSSRYVAFYVDGDGNFKPKAECTFSEAVPELTEEMEREALAFVRVKASEAQKQDSSADFAYDFDPIAWMLRREPK